MARAVCECKYNLRIKNLKVFGKLIGIENKFVMSGTRWEYYKCMHFWSIYNYTYLSTLFLILCNNRRLSFPTCLMSLLMKTCLSRDSSFVTSIIFFLLPSISKFSSTFSLLNSDDFSRSKVGSLSILADSIASSPFSVNWWSSLVLLIDISLTVPPWENIVMYNWEKASAFEECWEAYHLQLVQV